MKRKRTLPDGSLKVERVKGLKHPAGAAYVVTEMWVAEYVPKGAEAATELHLITRIDGLDTPIITRFENPEALNFLIEELIAYKKRIWADSPMPFPIDEDAIHNVPDEVFTDADEESTLESVTDAPTV